MPYKVYFFKIILICFLFLKAEAQNYTPKIALNLGFGLNTSKNITTSIQSEARLFSLSKNIGYNIQTGHTSTSQKYNHKLNNSIETQTYFSDRISISNGILYRLNYKKTIFDFGIYGGIVRNVSIIPKEVVNFRNIDPTIPINMNNDFMTFKYQSKHIAYLFGQGISFSYSKLNSKKINSGLKLTFYSDKYEKGITLGGMIYSN